MPFKYEYPLKKDICNLKIQKSILAYRHIFEHTLKNVEYKKDPFYTFDYIRNIEKDIILVHLSILWREEILNTIICIK